MASSMGAQRSDDSAGLLTWAGTMVTDHPADMRLLIGYNGWSAVRCAVGEKRRLPRGTWGSRCDDQSAESLGDRG